MLVKCIRAYYTNAIKVGKIYDARLCQPMWSGSNMTFFGYNINGCAYSNAGFRELTAIEKLKYFNRRKRGKKESNL